jgi:COP9 signalosome complex subunit 2
MSDSEEYDYGSDEEQYNYSDEDQNEGGEGEDDKIAIENAYYEGDDLKDDDPQKACEKFEKVVQLEGEKGTEVKWRFKALQHLVVLKFKLGKFDDMASRYAEMLTHSTTVTRNECGDGVNAVLDALADPTSSCADAIMRKMFDITFSALKNSQNERLWFNCNVKAGKLHLSRGDHTSVEKCVLELKHSCQNADGSDDLSKGTSLLEAYALEISLCAATRDARRMKKIYPRTLNLNAAVADPRIMGVIREEGGRMHMRDASWDDAYNEFYAGFRAYQEAGNARAKDCLKYVVLANMLALSDINPFDAREAKAYQEETEVAAMRRLRVCYDGNDLRQFETTLCDKRNNIQSDPFLMEYVDPLRRRMREQVLLALVKPYRRVKLDFLAGKLNLSVEAVEQVVVTMILDDRIKGEVDMLEGHLVLQGPPEAKKHLELTKWAGALESLAQGFANRAQ